MERQVAQIAEWVTAEFELLAAFFDSGKIDSARFTELLFSARRGFDELELKSKGDEFGRACLQFYHQYEQFINRVVKNQVFQRCNELDSYTLLYYLIQRFEASAKVMNAAKEVLTPTVVFIDHYYLLAESFREGVVYSYSGEFLFVWHICFSKLSKKLVNVLSNALFKNLTDRTPVEKEVRLLQIFSWASYGPLGESKRGQLGTYEFVLTDRAIVHSPESSFRQLIYSQLHQQLKQKLQPWAKQKCEVMSYQEYLYLARRTLAYCEEQSFLCRQWAPSKAFTEETLKLVQHVLVTQQWERLSTKPEGFYQALLHKRLDVLSSTYRLAKRCPQVEGKCLDLFRTFILQENGKVLALEEGVKFVEQQIAFKRQINEFVQQPFEGAQAFQEGCEKQFRRSLELRKGVEGLLAGYFGRMISSGKTEQQLEGALLLFNQLPAKDSFLQIYQRGLMKRLLQSSSRVQTEQEVVDRLKKEVVNYYTQKLEHMLSDLVKSTRYQEQFLKECRTPGVERIRPIIVSVSYWPEIADEAVPKIGSLQSLRGEFEKWFVASSKGEKALRWRPLVGSSQLRKGRQVFRVSNVQLHMVMLFEEGGRHQLKFSQLRSIDCGEQTFYLNLLKLVQLGIIERQPQIEPDSRFTFQEKLFLNRDFNDPKRVVVDCRPDWETVQRVRRLGLATEEEREDEVGLRGMRESVVKAKMVKFMKARKEVHEKDLLNYPIQKIKLFKVTSEMAAECLAQLLAQEYCERSSANDKHLLYRM